MATILKCKMCGGDIEVNENMTIGVCEYCGSTMTIPRIDTDRKARLFNHANAYRQNNEFDKAYEAYSAIIKEDEQEAEAYWGQILSEYGVEYVVDPKTHKRVPTCHRTRFQPIKTTTNYQMACKYADAEQQFLYRDEAEVLDKIQKKILALSEKEDPYDVFICYKETDEQGERTADSVLAQTIYDALSEKGIRVFFSRVSLEDKLGQNYEPFIFSALNSAKVMLLVTTSAEYCNAVWVKNEWARFLNFMDDDSGKTIIPVYQDMSPYELPDELVKFQAQNMAKVGAIQDLVHGVQRLLGVDSRAAKLSDNAVQQLIEKNVAKQQKSTVTKSVLITMIAMVCTILLLVGGRFVYQSYLQPYFVTLGTYREAKLEFKAGNYAIAASKFSSVSDFKDSAEMRMESMYQIGLSEFNSSNYDGAISTFAQIVNYRDSGILRQKALYSECLKQIESGNLTRANILFNQLDDTQRSDEIEQLMADLKIKIKYRNATELLTQEPDSMGAANLLLETLDYKDSRELVYSIAVAVATKKLSSPSDHLDAANLFWELGDYKDSKEQYLEQAYNYAKRNVAMTNITTALPLLVTLSDNNYKDSDILLNDSLAFLYKQAQQQYKSGKLNKALEYFIILSEYNYSDSKDQCAKISSEIQIRDEAHEQFKKSLIGTWESASGKIIKIDENYMIFRNNTDVRCEIIFSVSSFSTFRFAGPNGLYYDASVQDNVLTIVYKSSWVRGEFEGEYRKVN